MKNLQRGKNWFQGGERGVKHRSSFKVGECCPRPTKTNQEVREYILTEKINKRMNMSFSGYILPIIVKVFPDPVCPL